MRGCGCKLSLLGLRFRGSGLSVVTYFLFHPGGFWRLPGLGFRVSISLDHEARNPKKSLNPKPESVTTLKPEHGRRHDTISGSCSIVMVASDGGKRWTCPARNPKDKNRAAAFCACWVHAGCTSALFLESHSDPNLSAPA